MNQKGFAPILIVIIIAVLVGGYLLYKNQTKLTPPSQLSDNTQSKNTTPPPQITKLPATSTKQITQPSQNNTSVSLPTQDGVDLENIKYTLPSGWKSEITNTKDSYGRRTLYILPNIGSGLLAIHIYDYPNNIGRREYYCKTTDYCIERTYFTQRQIGNISGYTANALDNSGGGTEYFGAKGNKFYIISTIRDITSTSDEFNTHFNEVLNSLIF